MQRFQPLPFQADDPVDITVDTAAPAVLANNIGILNNEFSVKHVVFVSTEFADFFPQDCGSLDAPVIVVHSELFVGAMSVIVRKPPAQQQTITSQDFLESRHDGNRTTFANQNGLDAERLIDRRFRRLHESASGISQHARCSLIGFQRPANTNGSMIGEVFLQPLGDRLGVLIGDQPKA